jgi:drug/metabolite transporter (DMT)-like permease
VEELHSRFWLAAGVSFTGVVLVAAGAKGGLAGNVWGYLLVLGGAATWAAYSVAIAPLMRRYSAARISTYTLTIGSIPLFVAAAPQLASQDYGSLPNLVWAAYVFAVVAPLFATNLLWFNAIARVGPSRAALYTNLQPFLGAVFALLILSESMTRVQVAGGLLIAVGLTLAARRQPVVVPAPSRTR